MEPASRFNHDEARQVMFVPCQSKKALQNWIRLYLGLDMPDCIVDSESNSSPMDALWEVYERAMKNDRPEFSRILSYASRSSFKTLAAAVLEVLMVIHLKRSVAHLSALKGQSKKSMSYVKKFFNRAYLKGFKASDSVERTEVLRYEHILTKYCLTEKEWLTLPAAEQAEFNPVENYITIIVATVAGCNSEHVPFMCVAGDTKLQIATNGSTNRTRKASTARGIHNKLAGRNPGGNPVHEYVPENIDHPKEKVQVLSIDLDTGALEFQTITHSHRRMAECVKIVTSDKELECSMDHPTFVVGKGFTPAIELAEGDRVVCLNKGQTNRRTPKARGTKNHSISPYLDTYNCRWEQVLLGSLLGDGGIYKKSNGNPYFKEQHGLDQCNYLQWKKSVLAEKLRIKDIKAISGYTQKPLVGIVSGQTPLLTPWVNFRKTLDGVEFLGALGLAVWYMDDGCAGNGFVLSTECWPLNIVKRLCKVLDNNFGIKTSPSQYTKLNGKSYWRITGGVDAKRRLVEICGKYIHPDLLYKFDLDNNKGVCHYCGREFWYVDAGCYTTYCGSTICKLLQDGSLTAKVIKEVQPIGLKPVYDFTVSKNNNFISNGFLSKNCVDEVDVLRDPAAYEEAKMIPDAVGENLPITLLTSTRKYSFGLVQREIDEAINEEGEKLLEIRHWNLIDVTEKCPPERHLPNEPKIPIYRCDELLKAISEKKWAALPQTEKDKYVKDEGYKGCLENCKIFSPCKGKLATKQLSTSNLLKKIHFTQKQFSVVSLEAAKAQLLCWKPSTEGLVYSRFSKEIHCISASKIYELITGESKPDMNKDELIRILKARGVTFFAGMDWGFTHNFSVTIGFRDGQRMFIVDQISAPELELGQQLDICQSKLWDYDASVYPDTAYPANIKTFKRNGYKMKDWSKGPGSVKDGIEIVRLKLMPAIGDPQLYVLADNPATNILVKSIERYHWKLDAAGELTDIPDDEGADECDSLRYLVMNVFDPKSKGIKIDQSGPKPQIPLSQQTYNPQTYNPQTAMKQVVREQIGLELEQILGTNSGPVSGKKGSFIFDL